MVLAEDCNPYSCCHVRFTGGLLSMTPAQQRRFDAVDRCGTRFAQQLKILMIFATRRHG